MCKCIKYIYIFDTTSTRHQIWNTITSDSYRYIHIYIYICIKKDNVCSGYEQEKRKVQVKKSTKFFYENNLMNCSSGTSPMHLRNELILEKTLFQVGVETTHGHFKVIHTSGSIPLRVFSGRRCHLDCLLRIFFFWYTAIQWLWKASEIISPKVSICAASTSPSGGSHVNLSSIVHRVSWPVKGSGSCYRVHFAMLPPIFLLRILTRFRVASDPCGARGPFMDLYLLFLYVSHASCPITASATAAQLL